SSQHYSIMSSTMRTTLQTVPESLPADHVSNTKCPIEESKDTNSIGTPSRNSLPGNFVSSNQPPYVDSQDSPKSHPSTKMVIGQYIVKVTSYKFIPMTLELFLMQLILPINAYFSLSSSSSFQVLGQGLLRSYRKFSLMGNSPLGSKKQVNQERLDSKVKRTRASKTKLCNKMDNIKIVKDKLTNFVKEFACRPTHCKTQNIVSVGRGDGFTLKSTLNKFYKASFSDITSLEHCFLVAEKSHFKIHDYKFHLFGFCYVRTPSGLIINTCVKDNEKVAFACFKICVCNSASLSLGYSLKPASSNTDKINFYVTERFSYRRPFNVHTLRIFRKYNSKWLITEHRVDV
ncbi:hypothetical protein L9F63_020865, partial [Diploptera punctata]